MTKPTKARSGGGYWAGQIGSTALFGVGFLVISTVMTASGTDEPGGAALLVLGGMLFLTTCAWAIDSVTRSTAEQRALFAWAITQHEGTGLPGNRPSAEDFVAMADAARARDGQLTLDQIRALQALRPDNPYPAALPIAGVQADHPVSSRGRVRNRTGIALIAIFLALTGLYCSFLPMVFVLGWPFQFTASILAVVAIVPRGRGRRLGIAAASISVLGTIVTLVMVVVSIGRAATG